MDNIFREIGPDEFDGHSVSLSVLRLLPQMAANVCGTEETKSFKPPVCAVVMRARRVIAHME